MLKFLYKILDIFNMCKHDYGYTNFSIKELNSKEISVLESQICSKCGDKIYKHYIQGKV